jgi:hypothetical protein
MIVNFTTTELGGNSWRYDYSFSGLNLSSNQELDIAFDASSFGTLSEGVAGTGFDLALFQPDLPPGAAGQYSLLALVNNPATTGTFSVDFIYKGTGTPGSQPFAIYDDNFIPIHLLLTGTTAPLASGAAPEPSTMWLSCMGIGLGAAIRARRRVRQSRT